MVDLHTHILSGLDDGADSWDTALDMARMAAASGTRVLAATSHGNLPDWPRSQAGEYAKRYGRAFEHLQTLLREENIPLTLTTGMEIFLREDHSVLELLKEGSLLPINGTRYLLVENSLDAPAYFIYRSLDKLLEQGYTPVLAHPERYVCVQNVPAHIFEWYQMGVLIQINKGSVFGRFGRAAQDAADRILRHRLAAIAASDAHSSLYRTTSMSSFWDLLSSRYGSACPKLLLEENPGRILKNQNVIWENPIPFYAGTS